MNDVMKLLDNGWGVLMFKDGLGQYTALAVREGESPDLARRRWLDHEPGPDVPFWEWAFDGPHRFSGAGLTPEAALRALTEKVLFRRLPVAGPPRNEGE